MVVLPSLSCKMVPFLMSRLFSLVFHLPASIPVRLSLPHSFCFHDPLTLYCNLTPQLCLSILHITPKLTIYAACYPPCTWQRSRRLRCAARSWRSSSWPSFLASSSVFGQGLGRGEVSGFYFSAPFLSSISCRPFVSLPPALQLSPLTLSAVQRYALLLILSSLCHAFFTTSCIIRFSFYTLSFLISNAISLPCFPLQHCPFPSHPTYLPLYWSILNFS